MSEQSSQEVIKIIIEDFLKNMGVIAKVELEDSITKGLVFNVDAHDSYMLIGRQGAHLHALQILIQAIAAKRLKDKFVPFMLDVDDYKRKREWFLKETAKQAVETCKRIGKPVPLEPMPNFERRVIHSYLQENFPDISSSSEGLEPRRRIVISVART